MFLHNTFMKRIPSLVVALSLLSTVSQAIGGSEDAQGQAGTIFQQQTNNLWTGTAGPLQSDNGIGGHGAAVAKANYIGGVFAIGSHGCVQPPTNQSDLAGGQASAGAYDFLDINSSTLALGTAVDITICLALSTHEQLTGTHNTGGSTEINAGHANFTLTASSYIGFVPDQLTVTSSYYHSGANGMLNAPTVSGLYSGLNSTHTYVLHTAVGDRYSLNTDVLTSNSVTGSDKDFGQGDFEAALAFGGTTSNGNVTIFSEGLNGTWANGSSCGLVTTLVPNNPYNPSPEPGTYLGVFGIGAAMLVKRYRRA